METLISVIVPVYNIESYISKCVESLCSQTYTNLEIILVDDGSSDSSSFICDAYAKQDERIMVIHKENDGLSEARNAGLKCAHGQYLMFIDGDDYVDHTMIEKMYET
ncbi:MAG: glycosyltransferase family 2 protein, partial [Lachnospiraceae bacterium]|nr:glycosyltransferase family 2 protein [Lachnospiraceae bacterium]